MIDKQVFAEGMGQLSGAFGREIDGAVSRMYFAILSPALDNAQFVDAVTRTIATETFWPSPAVVLEKAGADADSRSLAAFRQMQDTVRAHGGFKFLPFAVFDQFDAPTKAGIKAVGGLAEIAATHRDRWPALVKKFQRAYAGALSPRPALANGERADARTRQLIADTGRTLALPPGDR